MAWPTADQPGLAAYLLTGQPHALHTYQSQGLRVYRVETEIAHLPATPPGPWPGAR
jgi:CHASE3 domain sensor protein